MGFNFEKRMDCKKVPETFMLCSRCKTKMSFFKTADGSYYKCSQCNGVWVEEDYSL